jgi:hypothetical protein
MSYFCNDCSYRGTKSGQGGECLACGSFALSKGSPVAEKKTPNKVRLLVLVALWAYLIGTIAWKLQL